MAFKNLWVCPRCGRQFANRNQSHSCGGFTVEDNLKGKGSETAELYRLFEEAVMACGTVTVVPSKNRIEFQSDMIFAAVSPKRERLEGRLTLSRRVEHSRFTKIEVPARDCYVHHFSISKPEEIDRELKSWLKEAYQAGESKTGK